MRNKIRAIHFVGIGGVGMAGLAEVMQALSYRVSGSDVCEQPTLARLRRRGVKICLPHAAANVQDADCVVYSNAIGADNAERVAAVARGIPVIPRAQMLAMLMRFKPGIAVAGTHGKTTVSSMIVAVMNAAELSPTCVIGGRLLALQDNQELLGTGEHVVVEADESDASFLHLYPEIAVVTNIDNDHLEFFNDNFAQLTKAFADFLGNLPFYGAAILCADDAATTALADDLQTLRCIRYGFAEDAAVRGTNVRTQGGGMAFDVQTAAGGESLYVNTIGKHNVQNALAAVAVALELDIAMPAIRKGLANFAGVGRRLQSYGEATVGGKRVLVMEDYAHHPTEITVTLSALRTGYHDRRLLVVFQPHRYSRTMRLLRQLALALAAADVVVLTPVYAAGESAPTENPAAALFAAVPSSPAKYFCDDLAAIPAQLENIVRDDDLLLFMGAGDVGGLASQLALGDQLASGDQLAPGDGGGGTVMMPLSRANPKWRENFPMAKISSWRAGGTARWLFTPNSPEDLRELATHPASQNMRMPPLFVGYGSNLLVRDGGYDGIVVRTAPGLSALHIDKSGGQDRIYAEAGVGCPKLAKRASAAGFGHAEFLIGIPGTVGGALAMNAGCHGFETWQTVRTVWVWREGALAKCRPESFTFGYRHVELPPKTYFVAAEFDLPRGDAAASAERMQYFLAHRRRTQPIESANAGSVFANPDNDYAGRLLEVCGLKNTRVGDAVVADKHANFIINEGGATAADIENLMSLMADKVRATTGVALRREVRIVGGGAMTTALLMGGSSPEREVSLMSGEQVLSALRRAGLSVAVVDPAADAQWLQTLQTHGVTRVFNILHGGGGENGEIRGALNCLNLPCTGSGLAATALAMNKHLSKMVWRSAGVPTPDWRVARTAADAKNILQTLPLPLFVKPVMGGSSTSSTAVMTADALPAAIATAASETGEALVETLVVGGEYTLSVLDDAALPLIHIRPASEFYDYNAKYIADDTEFICPCDLPAKTQARLTEQGLAAFRALNCGKWGRVDLMLSESGGAQFLEVNTVPGMTSHSLVPMAAKAAGMTFDDLVLRILESAEVLP